MTTAILILSAVIVVLTVAAGILQYRLLRAQDDLQAYQAIVGDLADEIARNDRKRGKA